MHGGIEFKFLSSTAVWLYNLIEKVTPGIHSGDEFGDDTSNLGSLKIKLAYSW